MRRSTSTLRAMLVLAGAAAALNACAADPGYDSSAFAYGYFDYVTGHMMSWTSRHTKELKWLGCFTYQAGLSAHDASALLVLVPTIRWPFEWSQHFTLQNSALHIRKRPSGWSPQK